ncbi:SDR family NAD(P)-dependent oxidoreductase [[Kitasatospora] papulosa]|uniref:SDR family NAD(P)-dependent oxidoreductase n=1 Tax=[Kitasatospora] papulosa TaxID=1464011 RepID=UPI0036835F34
MTDISVAAEPTPDAIAVVGMAGRFPGSADISEFWRHCVSGDECITRWSDKTAVDGCVPAGGLLADPDRFDASFFGVAPNEAELLDPQHRVFLELAWHAMESASVVPGDEKLNVAVYAAAAPSRYRIGGGSGELDENERYRRMIANGPDFLATRVSYLLDLRGEAVNVQTACSSSLVAVHMAACNLQLGLSDVALAGGVYLDPDQSRGYRYQEGMIASPDGHCRPFDAAAGGMVPGNGAGVVVLQRLEDAVAQGRTIHAVIRSTATNNDGSAKSSFMAPNVRGQSEVIASALALAEVPAESIGYFEAHGTGTRLGDSIEIEAARRAFEVFTDESGFCVLGSLKANFGHLDRAAGIAGLIKAICAVREGVRPPLAGYTESNPDLNLDQSPFRVARIAEPWPEQPRRAAVSSFGVGGTNAHAIVEQYTPSTPAASNDDASPTAHRTGRPTAIPLSAPDQDGLLRLARTLASHLDEAPGETELADVAHTLAAGRRAYEGARAIVVAEHTAGARKALRELASAVRPTGPGHLAFTFPGQAGASVAQDEALYWSNPIFRAEIDACASALNLSGSELLATLSDAGTGPGAAGNPYQPALVAVQIARARLLTSAGVRPNAYVGSSLGEYTAAHLAGVFPREALMRLLDTRDELMRASEPGAMLSVACSSAEVADLVGAEVALAADNAPDRIVLAGAPEALSEAELILAGRGHRCRRLPGSIAFHSPLMDPLLSAFRQAVEEAQPVPTEVSALSTLTGTWITPGTWADPDHWVRQLREPIRFRSATAALAAAGYTRFLELGPGHALTSLVPRTTPVPTCAISMRDHDGNEGFSGLVTALGQLWADGEAIDWDVVNTSSGRRFVELPGYPFALNRYWRHEAPEAALPSSSSATDETGQAGEISRPAWLATPRGGQSAAADSRQYALVAGSHVDAPSRALAAALTSRLERLGHAVETVPALGRPVSPAERVVDLTLLDSPSTGKEPPAGDSALLRWLERGLLAPTRSTLAHRPAVRQVLVVTRGLFPVAAGDLSDPGAAAVAGLVRCAPHDLPGVTTHLVDLDPHAVPDADATADALVAELTDPAPRDVAFRAGVRFVAHYIPVAPSGAVQLRDGGTYLLLGGTGRLGAVVARAISEEVRATVLLAGRNPDRNPSAERIELLSRARASGCAVHEIAVDITDAQALADCVYSIVAEHGRLDGLFHLAGHTDTREFPVLEETDADAAVAVAAAKVRGAALLPALMDDVDCDFVLLFSSISTVIGACGFGAYVSANAYLDALASAERARTGRVWTSVCWDGWSPDGSSHPRLLGTDDGVRLIRQVLHTDAPVVVAATDPVEHLREKVAEDLRRVAAANDSGGGPDPAQHTVLSTILAVVTEVTGRQPEDLTTDLSRMGVDSLQMMQIAARLRTKLRADVSLATMLRATSVEELVLLCGPGTPSGMSARAEQPASRATALPTRNGRLASMQQRLWYLWQLDPDASHYNIPFGWSFPGLEAGRVQAAVGMLLDRHPALRTAYRLGSDGEPHREFVDAEAIPVDIVEIPGRDIASREAAFTELAGAWTRRPFALDRHAVRVLIATEPDCVRVLFVCHHVSVDAWSVDLIRRDLTALVGDQSPETLSALTASYDDFVAWEDSIRSGSGYTDHLRYWAEVTEDLRVTVPPRDPQADGEPDRAGEVRRVLCAETLSRLRETAAGQGATLYMATLTALAHSMTAWCGTEEVVIGTNLANRSLPEFEPLVGMFVDPVVLRIRPRSAGPRFRDALSHVREVFVGALEHSDVAYQDVVRHSSLGGGNSRNPLFSVIATMFDGEGGTPDAATAPTPLALPTPQQVKFDLSVEFQPFQGGLLIHVIYPTSEYLASTIERFTDGLVRLLTGFAEQGEAFIARPAPIQEAVSASSVRERFGRRFGRLSYPVTATNHSS